MSQLPLFRLHINLLHPNRMLLLEHPKSLPESEHRILLNLISHRKHFDAGSQNWVCCRLNLEEVQPLLKPLLIEELNFIQTANLVAYIVVVPTEQGFD